MPRNVYNCTCGNEWVYVGPYSDRTCKVCNTSTSPSLPTDINAPAVFEVVDPSRGTKWRDNFEEKAEKRASKYLKITAKETARVHGKDPKSLGLTEDDTKTI